MRGKKTNDIKRKRIANGIRSVAMSTSEKVKSFFPISLRDKTNVLGNSMARTGAALVPTEATKKRERSSLF